MNRAALRPAMAAMALTLALAASPAFAQDQTTGTGDEGAAPATMGPWRHGTSLVGDVKYPEDFARFDYVNPDAPKGGTVRFGASGTFDSLNDVPDTGTSGISPGLIYDALMTSSMDEVSTMYGLLAEAMRYPDDYSSVTFRLRDGAYWHDGEPITPEDVVFSFEALKENSAQQAFYYQHVTKAEVTGEREVTFTFDQSGNRELPHIVGQLVVYPKHFWEGTDANGKPRDISRSTLEIPLGSGPYRVKSVEPGTRIVYERVDDYWGKDLPVNIGENNLDEIRQEFFRDDTVLLEALKGDQYDWRSENIARKWANDYDFPAVRDGRVVLKEYPQPYRASGTTVGFYFNLERKPFDDQRVRRAFNLAFPFEELNKTVFYGQYERVDSYYFGLPFASKGLPEGRELEMLEDVRDRFPDSVPESVFTEPYVNPVNTPETERGNLREALQLLGEAGYKLDGGRLIGPDGKQLETEYMIINGSSFEPIALLYQKQLAKIGIKMTIRKVDTSQYINRRRSRDFDVIYTGHGQSMSLGNEQLDYFGSDSAARDGSGNFGAIRNPAVDALIRKILDAPDRADLEAASAALDRLLLHEDYIVPGWTLRYARTARWDRFSHPDPLPEYAIGFPTIWWWDEAKAAAVEAKQ